MEFSFSGGGMNRAAHLRGDAGEPLSARLAARSQGRVLPIWRGKPLIAAGQGLAWVEPDHPVLGDAGLEVFLGLDDRGGGLFAADLSGWQPDPGEPAVEPGFFDASAQRHPALPADAAFVELRGAMTALSPLEAEAAATARSLLGWHASHGFCSACGQRSNAVQAGWQRTCPACGTHHFPRTDPVVIMLVLRGNRLLIGRSPGWPEGMYSCLAGFVEPGETVEAAVRREVHEETGITVGPVRYMASQPWPFPSSLMLGCRAEATNDEIRIDPAELEAALWITREEMVRVMAGNHPLIRAPRPGAIARSLVERWLADRLD